jgi:amidase
LTLVEMRQGLNEKQFSPQELLTAHLEQGRRLDKRLNAFTIRFDPPRATGDAGVLAGIPLSVKDSLDVAGYATVCGSPARTTARAARHALCVERLLGAGAVLLGKTNTPELLMNWETHNTIYGFTANPYDPGYTAGGSSGGEAAAIAAGLSAGGIGSDGGGSIRLPAGFCGICGLKPTPGRVPATGHFPSVGLPGGLLGVIGPMARTVSDLKLIFGVVSGHADSDPFSVPAAACDIPDAFDVLAFDHPDTQIAAQAFGLDPREFRWPHWERAFAVWEFFFLRLNAHAIGFPTPHTAEFLALPPPSAEEILAMFAARDSLRRDLLERMSERTVLLLPNPGVAPWRPGEFPGVRAMAPLTLANLLGLPALAIPIGFDPQGLPRSVQLVAKPWAEDQLLRFGEKLESRRGPFPRPALAQAL